MDRKRILITGATGFIGRSLASCLSASGYEVVGLTRRPAAERDALEGCVLDHWDGRTAVGWGGRVEGALAVINLAGDNLGRGRWTAAKKRRILESRVDAGAAVVEAIEAARVKPEVLIQASAVGYYGERSDEALDESSSGGSDFLAEVARRWEESTRAVEECGVRRVIIRSGVVLGRGGGVLPRLTLPFRFFAGGPLGTGRQWVSWIHLDDELRAILFLIDRPDLDGAFNLTAPGPLTQGHFCRALGRVMRRPCWLRIPAPVLRLLFGAKAETTVLAGQRVLPRRLSQAGFAFNFSDAESALADLLARPVAR